MADVPHFWRAIWAPTLVGSVAGGAGVLGNFWHRMGMPALLERHLPVGDARCRPSAAVAVRLVVTNLPGRVRYRACTRPEFTAVPRRRNPPPAHPLHAATLGGRRHRAEVCFPLAFRLRGDCGVPSTVRPR